ncbi:ABC transporter ATP-binding protein [Cellulomonas edaphi]|uniref:ABC transporter ATP-binding protein n=1 Tax=Cellulomonas edaphi TaxID=3053468 RepID=A0ABT7S294_9CELL|nr:ABC transporter ATP-binding protein [Cellulomons edaphi]MDM7829740.1 ABC transporter ATP-binding protein [Cellulomons edaphi]
MTAHALEAAGLTLAYDKRVISTDLSVHVPAGSFTAIIGPNACGKSTLLRALSRLLAPRAGTVLLDGRDIAERGAKELARELGLLPQTSLAPDGIRVADLVARGRFPHQRVFDRWSPDDEAAVLRAMSATDVLDLSGRLVDELSGGQRQRVWVAMALAQETATLLLDEPTTFLDIAHQIEVLELFRRINLEDGRTLVAVLHDLNQAARYASHIIAMKDGRVVAAGAPTDVITPEVVQDVFSVPCRVIEDPEAHTPLVIPLVRR